MQIFGAYRLDAGNMTQRTKLQNRSLHKYFELLAIAMDDAGLDMRETITVPIKPTKDNVKAEMGHPIMKAMYPEAKSTADLETDQISELYEVMNRFTAQRLGISVEFPCDESLSYEAEIKGRR